jgi:hypothetical protein
MDQHQVLVFCRWWRPLLSLPCLSTGRLSPDEQQRLQLWQLQSRHSFQGDGPAESAPPQLHCSSTPEPLSPALLDGVEPIPPAVELCPRQYSPHQLARSCVSRRFIMLLSSGPGGGLAMRRRFHAGDSVVTGRGCSKIHHRSSPLLTTNRPSMSIFRVRSMKRSDFDITGFRYSYAASSPGRMHSDICSAESSYSKRRSIKLTKICRQHHYPL